jgi:hypothetical protein
MPHCNLLSRDCTFNVTDDLTGVPFNVHMDGTLWDRTVTIFDARFTEGFTPLGQKVRELDAAGLYRLDRKRGGFMMHGGVDEWSLSPRTVRLIADWFMANE